MNRNRLLKPDALPVLAFPFRVFFLLCALAGLILVPVWLLVWTQGMGSGFPVLPLFWHQHEMLAGFLNAAIAGFLLTAVCNWTKTSPVVGLNLLGLALVWLAGRLAMAFGSDMPTLAAAVDLAFMPLVAFAVGKRVWQARQTRQWLLLLVLAAFWGLDLGFHWTGHPRFLRALVLLAAVLILLIGGRITPAFTANWLRLHGGDPAAVHHRPRLDMANLFVTLALVVFTAVGWTPVWLATPLAWVAAALALVRLVGWAGWRTRAEPLLWVLHLGHLWVVLGLVLYGLAQWGLVPRTAWLHALGAGAMGTMILGVMTRVAMGHTGRTLRLRPGGLWAYVAMLGAGVVRVLGAMGGMRDELAWWLAGGLWALALLIFLLAYAPILWAPRADGRPG